MAKAGRKRKTDVVRDKNGISRQSRLDERRYYAETLIRRGKELQSEGIDPEHAPNRLAGFTLGKLRLMFKEDSANPEGITQQQYDDGCEWAEVIHRHAQIMGYRLSVKSPALLFVGGSSTAAEPTQEIIAAIKSKFINCYNALMVVSRAEGLRARDVAYGVCVDNWPLGILSRDDLGTLRIALNAIGRALRGKEVQ